MFVYCALYLCIAFCAVVVDFFDLDQSKKASLTHRVSSGCVCVAFGEELYAFASFLFMSVLLSNTSLMMSTSFVLILGPRSVSVSI